MNSPVKARAGRGKILFIVAVIAVILSISLSLLLHLYLNSNSFRALLEDTLEEAMEMDVAIGALAVDIRSGVVVQDLVMTGRGSGAVAVLHINIPRVEAGWSIGGLLAGRVDRVTILKPEIIFNIKRGGATDGDANAGGGERGVMPISLKRVVIEGGEVTVKSGDTPPLTIGPVEFVLDEMAGGRGRGEMSAYIPELDAGLSLEAVVDMKGLTLNGGHLDLGSIDLETLSAGRFSTFNEGMIRGTVRSTVDITRNEGGGFGLDYIGIFKNVGTGGDGEILHGGVSGEIEAKMNISADFDHIGVTAVGEAGTSATENGVRHDITFNGKYDLKGREVTIEEASLSSTLFGSMTAIGAISDFPSPRAVYAIDIKTEHLSLSNINDRLLTPLGYGAEGVSYDGSVSGTVGFYGSLATDVKFQSALTIDGFAMGGGPFKVDLQERPLKLSSKGYYEAGRDHLELEFLEAYLNAFKVATVRGSLERLSSGLPDFDFSVMMDETPLGEIGDFMSGLMGREALITELSGLVDVTVAVRGSAVPPVGDSPPGIPYDVSGSVEVALKEGGFSSSDGAMIGEGIGANLSGLFSLSLPERKAVFDVTASGGGFELLLGSFYGDFTERDVHLALRGEYGGVSDSLTISGMKAGLGEMATAELSAHIAALTTAPLFDGSLQLDILSLRKVYDSFVRETFREEMPSLATLELDGAASLRLQGKGSLEGFNVSGEMNLSHAAVTGEESGLSVKGIEMALPIEVAYPLPGEGGEVAPEAVRSGSLFIDSISWDTVEIDNLALSPSIWRNDLLFNEAIELPLFSGTVRFPNLYYRDILSTDRELLITLVLDGIDLADLSASIGLPPFSGSLAGTIPMARFSGSSLTVGGEIIMRLFDGEMVISRIAVEDLFSPAASVGLSLELSDIDLGLMTDAFEFGRITGVLQGYVRELVITGGQPESFDARIETIPRRGVGQRISVRALKKISIFGSDATGSILSSGIYRFFKEYRYSKMGFKGVLKEDNFILTGIETVGNKGYLIKGAFLPPRVDVVSYSQNISFKELVRRIKRIQAVE